MGRLTEVQIKAKLKNWNKIFKKSSKTKKRMMIAQDVIDQIRKKKFIPTQESYIQDIDKEIPFGEELSFILYGAKCEACALGSMFISSIRLGNSFELKTKRNLRLSGECVLGDPHKIERPRLRKYFSPQQLSSIESAFMSSSYIDKKVGNIGQRRKYRNKLDSAINYRVNCNLYMDRDDDKALIKIMKNIIENKGLFKP